MNFKTNDSAFYSVDYIQIFIIKQSDIITCKCKTCLFLNSKINKNAVLFDVFIHNVNDDTIRIQNVLN